MGANENMETNGIFKKNKMFEIIQLVILVICLSSLLVFGYIKYPLIKTIIQMDKKEELATIKISKISALANGDKLFCKNQIVSTQNGWILDGDLLIKDERIYFSLDECFVRDPKNHRFVFDYLIDSNSSKQ